MYFAAHEGMPYAIHGGRVKTRMMQFSVNEEEKTLIEKCAKTLGMTEPAC